jgi:hypothetical protein
MADKDRAKEFEKEQIRSMLNSQGKTSPIFGWKIPTPTIEDFAFINLYSEKIRAQQAELIVQEEKNKVELEKLNIEKERAIVNLIKTSEEVEIEEAGDLTNGINLGLLVSQNSVSVNAGKENGVSHYRRYKFKHGRQTTEINDSSDKQAEREQ